MPHPNAVLLHTLFSSLDRHDHRTMAECYHPKATFHDIAFDLQGKDWICAMWHMICSGESKIRATFEVVDADDERGQVRLVDDYTFTSTGRPVHNVIDSRFRFNNGLIAEHHDFCDAAKWADMAMGGPKGFLAGRVRFVRSYAALKKLKGFIAEHREEYAQLR